jgi:hypothetical protein
MGLNSAMRILQVFGLATLFFASTSHAAEPVDLELVLALDASNSVSDQEFALQAQGLADAFGGDAVIQAVLEGAPGGVAVAVMQWSNAQHQVTSVPWRVLRSAADGRQLAAELVVMRRRLKGGTAISGALGYAQGLILENAFEGTRKIIDVSGDGPDLHLVHVQRARDEAVDAGITINGLAIVNEDEKLEAFYRHNVIGGDNAFVMTANDFSDYAAAIREKLLRELAIPQLAGLAEAKNATGQPLKTGMAQKQFPSRHQSGRLMTGDLGAAWY